MQKPPLVSCIAKFNHRIIEVEGTPRLFWPNPVQEIHSYLLHTPPVTLAPGPEAGKKKEPLQDP